MTSARQSSVDGPKKQNDSPDEARFSCVAPILGFTSRLGLVSSFHNAALSSLCSRNKNMQTPGVAHDGWLSNALQPGETRACRGWPMPAAHATPPRTIWSKATTESVANARHRLAVPARPSDAVCGSCNLVGSASHPNAAFEAPTGRSPLRPSLSPAWPCWLTINAAQPPPVGCSWLLESGKERAPVSWSGELRYCRCEVVFTSSPGPLFELSSRGAGSTLPFFFYVIGSLDGLSFAFLPYFKKLFAGPVGMRLPFSPQYESFDGCFW